MGTEVLLVQGLVLAFTAVLWWIARRDLAARAAPPGMPPADTAELEQLCATLETVVTDLSRRMEAVESRLPKPKTPKMFAEPVPLPAPEPIAVPEAAVMDDPMTSASLPETLPAPEAMPALPPDTRYAPVYALLASGLSDPVEIARQTGLGRGEVDLILSLRDRRAL